MDEAEDTDARLAALDARLAELEGELLGEEPRPAPEPVAAGAPAGDELDRFGEELRTLAGELVAAWDRVAARERTGAAPAPSPARHRLELDARGDLQALAALERALLAAPGIGTVEVGAVAGGRALLTVALTEQGSR